MAVACWSALSQAATLVRYPYLQDVRSDRATVLWTTLERGAGSVRYSRDFSFSRAVPARVTEFLPAQTGLSFAYYQYQAELTPLSAGTEYFYQIVVDGQDLTLDSELLFRTAGLNPFYFLAFGDSGQGTREQRTLAARMLFENPVPDLVLHAGDIAYPSGSFSQFQERYFNVYQDLMKRVPFFPSPGNHEYETNNAAPFVALHAVPTDDVPAADRGRYYSFDWGNVHFIALDSTALVFDAVANRMLEWLEKDLQKSRSFWRVPYFHHPPYASGQNENDPVSALVRTKVVPILERHELPLVLDAHEHSYQRTFPLRGSAVTEDGTGTVYITTGGGGAALYPVFPRPFIAVAQSAHHYVRAEVRDIQMTLRAVRIDGQIIDSVTLAPTPRISSTSTVNAASFTPSVAPGALIAIFGRNLAGTVTAASQLPLPKELGGATVTLNGMPLPLIYVSATQINAQLPFDAQGQATLRVTTSNGSSESLLSIAEAAPAIFSVLGESSVLPAIAHLSGALVTPQSPAVPGEHVTVYTTGLGAVNGAIEAGQPAPVFPLMQTRQTVRVELGSTLLIPSFAGLVPGFAGLYQVNVQVPLNLSPGTHTLRIVVGTSARSNTVGLPVLSVAARLPATADSKHLPAWAETMLLGGTALETCPPAAAKARGVYWPEPDAASNCAVTVSQRRRRSRTSK